MIAPPAMPNQHKTMGVAAVTQNAQAAAAAINVPSIRGGVAQPHVTNQVYALG